MCAVWYYFTSVYGDETITTIKIMNKFIIYKSLFIHLHDSFLLAFFAHPPSQFQETTILLYVIIDYIF